MTTLPNLQKGVVKDPTPPATDTVISPITIPDGTTLITTKTTNETIDNVDQIIDYISGDNSPNFIPQSAIGNLVVDLAAKEDSLGFTPENIANKVTFVGTPGNDTNYTTEKAVRDALDLKEDSLGFTPEDSANKGAISGYAGLDASQDLLLTNFPTGNGLEVLRRNVGNTALEFAVLAQTLEGLTDTTIVAEAANEVLVRNAGNTAWVNELLDNANLATGVFGNITGLGVQTQDLDMAANAITSSGANDLLLNAPTGEFVKIQINSVDEYIFTNVVADFGGNIIDNVGEVGFNTSGLEFTEVAGSMEFRAPLANNFTFNINSILEYTFDATTLNMGANSITNINNATGLVFASGESLTATGTFFTANVALGDFFVVNVDSQNEYFFGAGESDWQGNDLTDVKAVRFFNSVILPAAGNMYIQEDSGVMKLNVATGESVSITINATSEFVLNATSLNIDEKFVDIGEIATPGNPAVNVGRLYVADDGGTTTLFFRDNTGAETNLLAGGSPTSISQLNTSITVTDTGADGLADFVIDGLSALQMSGTFARIQTGTSFQTAISPTTANISGSQDTLVVDGNLFVYNNTVATFNSLASTDFQIGSVIYLQFPSADGTGVTLIHDFAAVNPQEPFWLLDETNYVVTNANANQILSFIYDGTYWVQQSHGVSAAGGSGDVVGPASSTANAIARFSGTTGKIIQNGVIIIDGSANMTLIRSAQFSNFNTQPGAALTWIQLNNAKFQLNTTAGNSITLSSNGTDVASFATTLIDFKSTNLRLTSAYVEFGEIGDPTAPGAALGRIYVKNVGGRTHLFIRDDVGVVDIQSGGTGDVVGPASAIDNALVSFDGTTGKLIQEAGGPGFVPTIDVAGTVTWPRYGIYSSNAVAGPGASVGWIGNQSNEMTINGNLASKLQVQQLTILRASATEVLLSDGINLVLGAGTNNGYIQLDSISSPATTGNAAIGRLFMDADNSDHLTIQRNGVEVDLESGAEVLLWTANHDADRFNLIDAGAIEFPLAGPIVNPLATSPSIYFDDALTPDALILNVPSTNEIIFTVNGVEEYTFSSSLFLGNGNVLRGFSQVNIQDTTTPLVVIENTTSSPAVAATIGEIRFRGDTVGGGAIDYGNIVVEVGDNSVGSADGEMRLEVVNGGSENVEYITLNETQSQTIHFKKNVQDFTMDPTTGVAEIIGLEGLRFTDDATQLTNTLSYIQRSNSSLITNSPTGEDIQLQINNSVELTIALNQITTPVGTDLSVGGDLVVGDRFQGNKGPDIVGAATITLGDGNYFDITGNTNIDFMTTTGWQAGSIVTLQFDANSGANDNTATPPANTAAFDLAGDFTASAGDTLTVVFDGTFWREISRSVN